MCSFLKSDRVVSKEVKEKGDCDRLDENDDQGRMTNDESGRLRHWSLVVRQYFTPQRRAGCTAPDDPPRVLRTLCCDVPATAECRPPRWRSAQSPPPAGRYQPARCPARCHRL